MPEENEDEKIQLAWMLSHPVFDKDFEMEETKKAAEKHAVKNAKQTKRKRSPASWNMPLPEQEIDLHGYSAEEAAASLEDMFDAMHLAGMSVLRIIHGGGNPAYGNVKHIIDRKVRSEWKGKIEFYKTEPDNAGASILKLAKHIKK